MNPRSDAADEPDASDETTTRLVGRPADPNARRKQPPVKVYLTAEERSDVEAAAERSGVSLSEAGRVALLAWSRENA